MSVVITIMGILVEVASLAAFHIGLLLVYCTVAIQIFTADFIDTVHLCSPTACCLFTYDFKNKDKKVLVLLKRLLNSGSFFYSAIQRIKISSYVNGDYLNLTLYVSD